ncbi:hypothetical protein Taro_002270 [Colocasia esculenta]|uniref:Uncharacterized protein n=1 Tax=Colocasia esculenta TaxID=4460 RepID=A0A843TKC1_COLES|nr:hypothetical protein [Colocasia esculenta]
MTKPIYNDPMLRKGIYSLNRHQASPMKQRFRKEQRFEEDTLRKKSGNTRSIRPNVKNKYKEHAQQKLQTLANPTLHLEISEEKGQSFSSTNIPLRGHRRTIYKQNPHVKGLIPPNRWNLPSIKGNGTFHRLGGGGMPSN